MGEGGGIVSPLREIYIKTIPEGIRKYVAGLELTEDIIHEADVDLSRYPESERGRKNFVDDRVSAATMSALSRRVDKWHLPADEMMFQELKHHVTEELQVRGRILSKEKEQ